MPVPPDPLRFEHRTDPGPALGLGTGSPRLSWTLADAEPGYRQGAYQVEITRDVVGLEPTVAVVDVESAEQVLVPWPFDPMRSRERAALRVRVRATEAEWTGWSELAVVEAGLLSPTDWTARFVSPRSIAAVGAPAPVLHGELTLTSAPLRARLHITAHGIHVTQINGRRVGADQLAPGWTSYAHRLRYQTYDVTDLLQVGTNRLDALLGNGWYRGRLGFQGKRALYGDRLALLAQLEVTCADGETVVLGTDGTWTASAGNVLADDLYDGQRTDLRPIDEVTPEPVDVIDEDMSRLVAADGPGVRVTDVLPAVSVWQSPNGKWLVDFGQNVVGWVRLRVRGLAAATEVTVRHAEVLEAGELGVRPLRTALATDVYIASGGPEEVCEPSLTFHGFRYAQIEGAGEVPPGDIEAVVIGTDLRRTGWFSCSEPLLQKFHDNVVWGMRGNFVDVPTDCPQRDERLGWTGDIQIFAPTAGFLFDTAGFLTSWLADLAADQQADGSVPFVIPDVIGMPGPAAAAWADAATVVPSVIHRLTGDAEILRRQLPSMRAWVDRITSLAGPDHVWRGGFQFGDWLDPTAPPEDPFAARVDPDVVATAHYALSARLVADAASVVGDKVTAQAYGELADVVRAAFAAEFVTATGRVLSDSQTGYAMALMWDLLPEAGQREHAAARLADLVRTAGFRIGTGFVGTPLVTDALTDAGHEAVAFRLVLQHGCPSWLYSVTMGATTVWERWDSMLPDGSINPGEMTSFNHYALGAVADWLHRRVAGLAPGSAGYRTIEVDPVLGGGLTHASARHLTPYGEAVVAWRREAGRLVLDVTVPVGSTASVRVPGSDEAVVVAHGRHHWDVADPAAADALGVAGPPATIRELLDDPDRWARVLDAGVRCDVVSTEQVASGRLTAYLDAPAADVARALTPLGPESASVDFVAMVAEAIG